MGKLGFIQSDEVESVAAEEEEEEEEEEEVCNLNDELVSALNILIDIIKYHKGTIKGIALSVDNQGVRTTQIHY